jgi:RHS repeat-associated protein
VHYRYGEDGDRTVKYNATSREETLYFNKMWQESAVGADPQRLETKHIFVGETRIASKNGYGERNAGYETRYWYHGDHLGSAQLVTDYRGRLYERLEYTPYGETWIEEKYADDDETAVPYRFTGKELDEETGLYYYGARYLDPKVSRWLSADPAMGDYLPSAPVNDEARRRNGNLPGMGGVFNYVNLHAYHYAGNNPVKYTDPDGRIPEKVVDHAVKAETKQSVRQIQLFNSLQTQVSLRDSGYNRERAKNACVVLTLMAAVQDYTNVALSQDQVTSLLDSFYDKGFINSKDVVQNRVGILNSTLDAIYWGVAPFGLIPRTLVR